MAMYDPVTNSFTEFTPMLKSNEVEIDLPLFEEPSYVPGISRVTDNGTLIASNNNINKESENIFNYIPQSDNTFEYLPMNNSDTYTIQPDLKINKNLTGRRKQAMEFFVRKGLNPIHAAGIVGNLLMESNLDPNAVNLKSKAFGIALWLGNRKTLLHNKYGKAPTFELQLDYLWYELTLGDEKKAYKHLLSTTNYFDAVKSVVNNFERPSEKEKNESIDRRLKFAEELLS